LVKRRCSFLFSDIPLALYIGYLGAGCRGKLAKVLRVG
jgi:hypothetical protein